MKHSTHHRAALLSAAALASSLGLLAACGLSKPGPGSKRSDLATCPSTPAQTLFSQALCVCEDYRDVGLGLTVTSPTGAAADVGVNGTSHVVGRVKVAGTWTSWKGLTGTGFVTVRDHLLSTGDVGGVGLLEVGKDLSVGGNLSSVGKLEVGGTLRVAGTTQLLPGSKPLAGTGPYAAPAKPPCGCDASTFFDVAKAVAEAKTQNDNAAAGLDPTGAQGKVGVQSLTLKTGRYYLSDVATIGKTNIVIDGAVALYVDGDVDSVGDEHLELGPGAVLDLYIAGSLRQVGHSALGDASRPGALRLYIGGSSPVALSVGKQSIHGLVYAPTAAIAFVGDAQVNGALFARSLDAVGKLELGYAPPAAPSDQVCSPPGNPDGDGPGNGGKGSQDGGVIN